MSDARSHSQLVTQTAWLLVLTRKLHLSNAISDAERSTLKSKILAFDERLLSAFDEPATDSAPHIVNALIGVLFDEGGAQSSGGRAESKRKAPDQKAVAASRAAPSAGARAEEDGGDDSSDALDLLERQDSTDYTTHSDGEEAPDERNVAGAADVLCLSSQEAVALRRVLSDTGFSDLSLHAVWDVFKASTRYSLGLDRMAFSECIAGIFEEAQAASEVEPDRKLLTSALQRFFELLDIRRTGVVDFALVVAGLALLSRDAPKEKMLFIFELLDKEGVGALTVDQLFDFITTSSAVITAVVAAGAQPPGAASTAPLGTEERSRLVEAMRKRSHSIFSAMDLDIVDEHTKIGHAMFTGWRNSPAALFGTLTRS